MNTDLTRLLSTFNLAVEAGLRVEAVQEDFAQNRNDRLVPALEEASTAFRRAADGCEEMIKRLMSP